MAPVRTFLAVCWLGVAISGCATRPADDRPWSLRTAARLEAGLNPRQVRLDPERAAEELRQALRLYSLADDEQGQVRSRLKLARLYLRQGQRELASAQIEEASGVAQRLGERGYLYRTALLQARLSDRPEAFEKALAFADSALEKAVVLTYLGRPREAYGLLGGNSSQIAAEAVDDYAFVLFHYAQAASDLETARRALALYKQADSFDGIASTLYMMGRVAGERQHPQAARRYFQRALVVSRALDEPARTARIEQALRGL